MNKLMSDLAPAAGVAMLTLLACAAPALASDSPLDALNMRMAHEAELASGETLLVAYHLHKLSTYRFCIPEQPGNLKLKVLHDGETTEVLDGTCETVTGRHIDVKADTRLPHGEVMALKFEKTKAA